MCATTRLDQAVAAAGQRLWNSLPAELQQPYLSVGQFRQALKTHCSADNWDFLFLFKPCINVLTCLLIY